MWSRTESRQNYVKSKQSEAELFKSKVSWSRNVRSEICEYQMWKTQIGLRLPTHIVRFITLFGYYRYTQISTSDPSVSLVLQEGNGLKILEFGHKNYKLFSCVLSFSNSIPIKKKMSSHVALYCFINKPFGNVQLESLQSTKHVPIAESF
jgi:hypothetical protein